MVAAAHVRNLIVIAIGYMVGGAAYAKLPAPVDGFLPLPLARPAIAFLLPTAAAVTYALLRVISLRDPIRRDDSTVAITYDAILFRIVLFVIGLHAIVLAGLLGATALAASGVPMLLGLVLVGVGNLLPRTRPNVVIGIRRSRTLADPVGWMRMNRVAGYVAVGLGTVLAASAALLAPGPKVRDVVSAAALAGAALLVVCYWSYSRPAVKTAPEPRPALSAKARGDQSNFYNWEVMLQMKVHATSLSEMAAKPESIRWLALACIAAAMISGLLLGLWELARPIFGHAGYTFASAPPVQLWSYGILEVLKPAGFLAGLFGLFLVATRRGMLLKIVMGLAVLGGAFSAVVWIMIAATARDDAIHVLNLRIGSDAFSNGALLYLWIAPAALGIAALRAHRISRWKAIWAIIVGLLGSRIFAYFPPGAAMVTEGIIWLVLGYAIYSSRSSA